MAKKCFVTARDIRNYRFIIVSIFVIFMLVTYLFKISEETNSIITSILAIVFALYCGKFQSLIKSVIEGKTIPPILLGIIAFLSLFFFMGIGSILIIIYLFVKSATVFQNKETTGEMNLPE